MHLHVCAMIVFYPDCEFEDNPTMGHCVYHIFIKVVSKTKLRLASKVFMTLAKKTLRL